MSQPLHIKDKIQQLVMGGQWMVVRYKAKGVDNFHNILFFQRKLELLH